MLFVAAFFFLGFAASPSARAQLSVQSIGVDLSTNASLSGNNSHCAADASGNVYCASTELYEIAATNGLVASSTQPVVVNSSLTFQQPVDIAVSPGGAVFVEDYIASNATVSIYNPSAGSPR